VGNLWIPAHLAFELRGGGEAPPLTPLKVKIKDNPSQTRKNREFALDRREVTDVSEPPDTGTASGKPQTARGREMDLPDWLRLPAADRYLAATRTAAAIRHIRARDASRAVVELAGQLADALAVRTDLRSDPMWQVRDSPRTRGTFALPHAGDYIGRSDALRVSRVEFPGQFHVSIAVSIPMP
jgi:hypothetical protein